MIDWVVAHWSELLLGASSAVGGLWALAKVIAPLTETKVDDKLAGALGKAHSAISWLLGLKK